MPATKHLPLVVFLALNMLACGQNYKTRRIKEYRLALTNDDLRLREEFRSLVDDFNRFAGTDALTFVDEPGDANCAIVVTKGLRSRDGKVGWGQWMSETESENSLTAIGHRPKRDIVYSMRLEFDEDYFRSRAGKDPVKIYEKQKLFFHEVGHGLEMVHNEKNRHDVMYPDVAGQKDFGKYFTNVRDYLED